MANYHDYKSVVTAKRNEMEINNLEEYYGEVRTPEAQQALAATYNYGISDERTTLIYCLEQTKVSKYVRLARFLREVSPIQNMVEYKQAQVMLGYKENEYVSSKKKLKTLYKEFKQIEKDSIRVNKRKAKKLHKFKDVQSFVRGGNLREVYYKLMSSGVPEYDKEALTQFFESCPELDFLDRSKLTRNTR